MPDSKLTNLVALVTPSSDDLLYIVDDPAGAAISKKVTVGNLFGQMLRDNSTPTFASLTATSFISTAGSGEFGAFKLGNSMGFHQISTGIAIDDGANRGIGFDLGRMRLRSGDSIGWTASSVESFASIDTAITRASTGVVGVTGFVIGSGTVVTNILSATATLDFPNTVAGTVADLTIALTGAVVGDTVALGVPNGSVAATSSYFAWVSAAGVVTIRHCPNGVAADPASGTFRVSIVRF